MTEKFKNNLKCICNNIVVFETSLEKIVHRYEDLYVELASSR